MSSSSNEVKIEKLNGTNYQSWKFNAKLVLMERGLWGLVTGDEVAPVTTDEDKKVKEVKEFNLRAQKAYSLIALALNKNLQVHVSNTVNPKTAWEILEKHFNFVSVTETVRVNRAFFAASMEEGGDVMEHITRMIGLQERLREMGETIDSKKFATVMLGSLPDSYDNFLTSLNARSADQLSWDEIKPSLVEEYMKRKEKKEKLRSEDALFVRRGAASFQYDNRGDNRGGYNNQHHGGGRGGGPSRGNSNRRGPICYKYNVHGHIARNCGQ